MSHELKSWQLEVSRSVFEGKNVLVIAPTGSGKSHLALCLAKSFKKTLWVLPTKALTREWFMKALSTLRERLHVNIYTGDYRRESNVYEGDLVFATYESAVLQLRRKDEWFKTLELLVFDEFQFVGEEERGGVVEELLILLSELNPQTQVLALSATIGNPEELAGWIARLFSRPVEVHEVPEHERPVKLIQSAHRFRNEAEKRRFLLELFKSNPTQQFLVFTPRRVEAENLAKYYRAFGVKTGVHHAALDRLSRISAEDSFRSGEIQALFCTATLQYGVNMPAHWVVIYDPVWNTRMGEFRIDTNDFLQMAGRAGRPITNPITGKVFTEGRVVVLSTDQREHMYVRSHLINQEPEPVISSFERDLVYRVHGFLLYRNANEVRRLLLKSLARLSKKELVKAFRALERMGFLVEGELSELGKFVAELNLHPFAAMRFIKGLKSWRNAEDFGKRACQLVFAEVANETSSLPPHVREYNDLLKWRFVEKPYLNGTLLLVNYLAPQTIRDRAAWYMYSFEKLAEFTGFKEHALSIMRERFVLEGLSEVERAISKLSSLLQSKEAYIEVAIREFDSSSNTGKSNWLGLDVYVEGAPRGWTEPVKVVKLSGRRVDAVLPENSALLSK